MLNWLQKIAQYGIGHKIAPGTILWVIDKYWRWKEYTTQDKDYNIHSGGYEHIGHDDIFPDMNDAKAGGRIDIKSGKGSVAIWVESVLRKKRVFDMCVQSYPGIKWYTWEQGEDIPISKIYQDMERI